VPVHVLYGGALRTSVEAYASLPGYHDDRGPEDHWLAEVTELAAGGFRGMKLRIGRHSQERELPILAAVRQSLSPDVKLMADGNAAYASGTALKIARGLEDLGFTWFEEPLPQSGYLGYPELRAKLGLPLAGGESLTTRAQAHELLNRACFDIIQPDVSICGGIAECLFIGELARLSAVRCIPHCWGGGLMLAATMQVAALLPDVSRLPGGDQPLLEVDVTENPFRTELLVGAPFALRDGCIELPSGPGLGVQMDEDVLQRYTA
jgi:D-galactarolactone cycloisomerase